MSSGIHGCDRSLEPWIVKAERRHPLKKAGSVVPDRGGTRHGDTSNAIGDEDTPTYPDTGDPDRRVTDFASNTTAARDYSPVWLNCMAADVTLEGALMNGAVRGAEAVRAILRYIRTLYEDQQFSFAGPVRGRLPLRLRLRRFSLVPLERRGRYRPCRLQPRNRVGHFGATASSSAGPKTMPGPSPATRRLPM
jgi:hypothetical protein